MPASSECDMCRRVGFEALGNTLDASGRADRALNSSDSCTGHSMLHEDTLPQIDCDSDVPLGELVNPQDRARAHCRSSDMCVVARSAAVSVQSCDCRGPMLQSRSVAPL